MMYDREEEVSLLFFTNTFTGDSKLYLEQEHV
jgi:hypothetical protein